jgi:hypothetical protein
MNLAFVLLAEAKFPKGEDVEKAFSAFAVKGQVLHVQDPKATKDGQGAAFELSLGAGGKGVVALMPMPVPNHEAEEASHFSVSFFGGRWRLPPHKAHLVVTVTDKAPPLEALSAFTSLVAAVAKATHAVGIYVGNAGATHDPKFFEEIAGERDTHSRLILWSGVSISKEDGRLNLLSLGMKQLALPDVLLSMPPSKADDALGTLFDLLGYLVDLGKPLPEGDTFGRTATEKIPVRYVPSPADPKVKVWSVSLD